MADKTLLAELIELCDRAIPQLDLQEAPAKVIAVYLRQARTVAKGLQTSAKGEAAHG